MYTMEVNPCVANILLDASIMLYIIKQQGWIYSLLKVPLKIWKQGLVPQRVLLDCGCGFQMTKPSIYNSITDLKTGSRAAKRRSLSKKFYSGIDLLADTSDIVNDECYVLHIYIPHFFYFLYVNNSTWVCLVYFSGKAYYYKDMAWTHKRIGRIECRKFRKEEAQS